MKGSGWSCSWLHRIFKTKTLQHSENSSWRKFHPRWLSSQPHSKQSLWHETESLNIGLTWLIIQSNTFWIRALRFFVCLKTFFLTINNFIIKLTIVKNCEIDFPPADLNRVTKVQWIHGFLAPLEVADIKVGQGMVDKSMHGAIRAVHVLVDHSRDEVWSEGDDKCLGIVVVKVVVGVEI